MAAVKEVRNNEQQQRAEEDVPLLSRRGERDGEKQFKMPTGAHPERISSEFTPLMAKIGRETCNFSPPVSKEL